MVPSLLETFADFSDYCGWCAQHCPDEEKYEMLVTCIRIQNSFAELSRDINLMLDKTSSDFLIKVINLFEKIIEFTKTEEDPARLKIHSKYPKDKWKLPGCSQIFNLAQSIEQTYSTNPSNNDFL